MGFRLALSAVAALGAALPAGVSGASPQPYLRSVGVSRGHVVAAFSVGELAPLHVAVASSPKTQLNNAFIPANVRFQEVIAGLRPARGGFTLRTRHTVPAGRYWVEVSARPVDVDCLPMKPCFERWSNVRLLVVQHRSG